MLAAIAWLALWPGSVPAAPIRATEAPEGSTIEWRLTGPGGGGWIQSIAWDPQDSEVLYVGCDVGGFYLSRDSGRHFEIRNRGLRDYFIEAIAVHPNDSRIILSAYADHSCNPAFLDIRCASFLGF